MYFNQLCHENMLDRQFRIQTEMMLNTDYHYDSLDVRTHSGTKTGEMVDTYNLYFHVTHY